MLYEVARPSHEGRVLFSTNAPDRVGYAQRKAGLLPLLTQKYVQKLTLTRSKT